jgi:hypothetical protein
MLIVMLAWAGPEALEVVGTGAAQASMTLQLVMPSPS